ncbi:hypothetical protein QE152_g9652 [Popillia japonica]|uniref:Uncharacterized protein n=1 Tax=Popillia japonica TaxID=7064 RepID=A0AAW1LYB5_POPJA
MSSNKPVKRTWESKTQVRRVSGRTEIEQKCRKVLEVHRVPLEIEQKCRKVLEVHRVPLDRAKQMARIKKDRHIQVRQPTVSMQKAFQIDIIRITCNMVENIAIFDLDWHNMGEQLDLYALSISGRDVGCRRAACHKHYDSRRLA